jgi:hypothetical protein
MELTYKDADKILNLVSGSSNPVLQKVDELICAIQSGEEIEYQDEDYEEEGD